MRLGDGPFLLQRYFLDQVRAIENALDERGAEATLGAVLSGDVDAPVGTKRPLAQLEKNLERFNRAFAEQLEAPLTLTDVAERIYQPLSASIYHPELSASAARSRFEKAALERDGGFAIRVGRNVDYDQVKAITNQGTVREHVHTGPERFKSGARLGAKDFQPAIQNRVFVATDPKDPKRILGHVRFYLRQDGETTLHELAVSEEAQGRGIGRALMYAMIAAANAQGHRTIRLTLPEGGPERFYRDLGFEIDRAATEAQRAKRDAQRARAEASGKPYRNRPLTSLRLTLRPTAALEVDLANPPSWFRTCIAPDPNTPPDVLARYARVVAALRETYSFSQDAGLTDEWRDRNLASGNDATGFCYPAAEAAYHMLGGKKLELSVRVISEGPHWYLVDKWGTRIDPTAEQFAKPPAYDQASSGFFLTGHAISKRGRALRQRAERLLRDAGY